jgi:aminoglycoside phosphotransferase (APT) family kinase protein
MSAPLDPELAGWVKAVTGADAVGAERRAAGASREGWAVDVERAGHAPEALWLRADSGHGPQSDTLYTLRREAAVYRALAGTAVPVPRVVAVHPARDVFLATRVEGRNWFSELKDPREQQAVATDFMRHLAALHRIDPATLDLPGFGAGRPLPELVQVEIDEWDAQSAAPATPPEPIVRLALRWLRRNLSIAHPEDRVALIQGDTGPGNFLYANGRVVAILDWELAHLGDPLDDLGWICVRDLQERFSVLSDRFSDYEQAAGARIDLERLRYFRLLAQTRCAIGTLNGLHARDAGGEIANHLIYSALHLRVLAEALAELVGIDPVVDPPPAATPSANSWLFDVALDELRDTIVPATNTAVATRRAKGLARVLKYLRELDRAGARATELELSDLRNLVGVDASTVEDGRAQLSARIDAGAAADARVVEYAVRRMARTTELLRPAMGALADRHFSPLTT